MLPVRKPRRVTLAVLVALLLGPLAVMTASVAAAPPAAAFGTSEPAPIPSISAGGYISCGVQTDGTVACWGENGTPSNDIANTHPGGAATPPAGVRFSEVNAGYATACGVTADEGSILCWGSGRFNKTLMVPAGRFKHVAPGTNYICALRSDNVIKCWGGDEPTLDPDQKVIRDVPAGEFTQVGVGARHACALRADGSIKCWGHNSGVNGSEGQTSVPGGNDTPGLYKYVTVGNFTSCALKTDNTPICWGRNNGQQFTLPTGTFTQINAGFAHVCGLRPDSTITCWGRNAEGQSSPIPAGTYTHVTAGTFHTCAMPTSGAPARCWGNNMSGRVQPNMNNAQPPKAYVGVAYKANFTMNPSVLSGAGDKAGISPAPAFSLVEGELPPGLTFSPTGVISGEPTTAGQYTVKVSASNGLSPRDCAKASNTGDSMFCTPGDSNSLATATRVFAFDVAAEVPAPGAISGRLTHTADGSGIADATVTLAHSDTTPVTETTTDGSGNYSFESVLPDAYRVTASGDGFLSQTKAATVTSGGSTTVNFSVAPRLTRPQVVGVWNNHWQTMADGVFVEWSEEFDMLQQVGGGYTVHGPSDSDCTGQAIATGFRSNWLAENPSTTTTPSRLPSRIHDIEMRGYENVTPGGTYHLRVAPDTAWGKTTGKQNTLTCVPYVAEFRAMDRGAVTGKVTDEAGAPIAGATVTVNRTIRQPGTMAGQATTDTSGNYTVSNLPPTSYLGYYNSPYDVVVSAPGYSPKTQARSAGLAFNPGRTAPPPVIDPSTSSATVNVSLVNNPPDAVADAYSHYGSDTALVVNGPGVLSNDSDVEGSALTASLVTNPATGTVTLNPDGSFSYQPNEDFVGTDSFTYRANDGLANSSEATVTITVDAGCRGQKATIVGTNGPDRLNGTRGADVIAGLGGDDSLTGAGANDIMCGGSGKDSLNAGGGDDYADGGSGNDGLKGGVGNDTLTGGVGGDTANGEDGNDTLAGGAGTPDACNGGKGTDVLASDHGCEKVIDVP